MLRVLHHEAINSAPLVGIAAILLVSSTAVAQSRTPQTPPPLPASSSSQLAAPPPAGQPAPAATPPPPPAAADEQEPGTAPPPPPQVAAGAMGRVGRVRVDLGSCRHRHLLRRRHSVRLLLHAGLRVELVRLAVGMGRLPLRRLGPRRLVPRLGPPGMGRSRWSARTRTPCDWSRTGHSSITLRPFAGPGVAFAEVVASTEVVAQVAAEATAAGAGSAQTHQRGERHGHQGPGAVLSTARSAASAATALGGGATAPGFAAIRPGRRTIGAGVSRVASPVRRRALRPRLAPHLHRPAPPARSRRRHRR